MSIENPSMARDTKITASVGRLAIEWISFHLYGEKLAETDKTSKNEYFL